MVVLLFNMPIWGC